MRNLISLLLVVSIAMPAFANPFEENAQSAKPDYDKVPNQLPIGLTLQELDADTLSAFGVKGQSVGLAITRIKKDSVASKKDFVTGDVITHINNEVIKGIKHYKELVDHALPNTTVSIKIFRDGEIKEVKLYRIHAYGIQTLNTMIIRSIFNPSIKDCHINKYNNKDPKTIKMKDLFKHEFAIFMIGCVGKTPHFIKITKKKLFGLWSDQMSPSFKRSKYKWL